MSGVISVLVGSSSPRITVATNGTFNDANIGAASSTYSLNSNGLVQSITTQSGTVTVENWVTPTYAASNYECRVTVTSGTLTSGTTGSWLALTSTRQWNVTQSVVGTKACTFTLDIGYAGKSTPLKTLTGITVQAQAS